MNSSYDAFYFDNFIENYAVLKGKAILYLRSTGWNASSDVDAINASQEIYKDILPDDLWNLLKNSEHVFAEVDDFDDMLNFLESNLPDSQESVTTPENYIFYSLANSIGQIVMTNE